MGDDTKRNVLLTGAIVLLLLSSLTGATLTGAVDWGRMWNDMVTTRPDAQDPDLLWQRAQEYYAAADKDTTMATMAKACARRILILNPRHIRARKMLAALFLKDKNFADAETECRAALLLDPSDLTARLGLASALRGQKQNKEALDIYHKVYDDPKANLFQKDEAQRNLQELDPNFAPLPPAYLLPTPLPSPSPSGGPKELNPPTDFNPKPSPVPTPTAALPLAVPSPVPPVVVR